jgi:hypothetical protein
VERFECPECGREVPADTSVCPGCGHLLPAVGHDDPAAATNSDDALRPAVTAVRNAGTTGGAPTWVLFVVVFIVGAVTLIAAAVSIAVIVDGATTGFGDTPVEGGSPTTGATPTDGATPTPVMVVSLPPVTRSEIEIGTCIDEEEFDKKLSHDEYTLSSCADPHDAEVYLIYEFPDGPYPGEEAVTDEIRTRCDDAFWPYVGDGYDPDAGSVRLGTSKWWPTESGWESGYRIGTCMMQAMDGTKLVGSTYWRTGKTFGSLIER